MSHYVVECCINVDHPEYRDASFQRRDKHRVVNRFEYRSQRAAVAEFNAILDGGSDFASEYVCWVEVFYVRPGKRARTVRRRVDRERPARWVYDYNPSPEGTKGWSLTDGTPYLHCEQCGLWLDDGFPCKHVDQAELESWMALGEKGRAILAERDAA